jgi:hypothetical protein
VREGFAAEATNDRPELPPESDVSTLTYAAALLAALSRYFAST